MGQGLIYTSNYLNYGATTSYQVVSSLVLLGRVDHRVQGQYNGLPDFTSTTMQGSATWTHNLLGGAFGAAYGISYAFTPNYIYQNNPNSGAITATQNGQTSFIGQFGSISYGRQFGFWTASASGSYSHGLTTYLVGYTQTSYAGTGSLSRNLKQWTTSIHGSYAHSHVDATNLTDNMSANFGASLAVRNFGVSGNYGKSSGNALQFATGIVPSPIPVGGPIPNFLIQFSGDSYGFGGNWRPKRRWNLSGSYTHLSYSTLNPLVGPLPVRNDSTQYYARSEYAFRQLFLYIGYNYVNQGYNATAANAYQYHSFYFGVSRQFNFF